MANRKLMIASLRETVGVVVENVTFVLGQMVVKKCYLIHYHFRDIEWSHGLIYFCSEEHYIVEIPLQIES